MVFSSVIFVFFFLPVVIIGYYLLPKIARNYFLLAASLFFYAWGEPKAVWVMVLSIVCNYLFGLLVGKTAGGADGITDGNGNERTEGRADDRTNGRDDGKANENTKGQISEKDDHKTGRKGLLVLAAAVNIGILFIYKYLGFATENLHAVFSQVPILQIALPIGISFYTFQGLSYVIDVYRGEKPLKNPFTLALYISMFPQLIAGPIVRYGDIAAQLQKRSYDSTMFAQGIRRFSAGLAKKVILANQMGALADMIFDSDYSVMGTGVAWLGTLAYTLQIFFDFSGYSDMAIGLGKMLGFTFLENFDRPYLSTSVSEFWRRWHMSLSGWFRDYVYIPLGGSRKGNVYLHLMIVFLLTGIWHGAGWGFLIWGLWHGCFVMAERYVAKRNRARSEEKEKSSKPCEGQTKDGQIKTTEKHEEQNDVKKVGQNSIKIGDQDKKPGSENRSVLRRAAGWLYTILVVMIGWTLFRIVDFPAFLKYLSVMVCFGQGSFQAFSLRYYLTNQRIFYLALSILACVPFGRILRHIVNGKTVDNGEGKGTVKVGESGKDREPEKDGESGNLLTEWLLNIYSLLLLVICYIYMINSTYNPFIYFRF
ncbi:MAG: MBOAT family protein [Lachnospiraceae bacterium]|nr:MBOAT family protein [Lachnospiraceae bacterium]